MDVHKKDYATVNSESMADYLSFLRQKYPKNVKIHLILDQGPYNISKETKKKAKELNIELIPFPIAIYPK
jgi:transposase